ncbi:MAG TPA: hypothetical protein VNT30_17290 [Stellaceae bacterium]|nr:hypothetical protein [Stellaceae bacterium]
MMRFKYSPNRALDVAQPVEIYRVIGRRPSALRVDGAADAAPADGGRYRLNELVYWRTRAEPGEQIHEHDRGLFLMTADDECHPISVTAPEALAPASAFTHAQATLTRDAEALGRMVAEGALVEAKPRRPSRPPSRPIDRVLPESHPLVIDHPITEAPVQVASVG